MHVVPAKAGTQCVLVLPICMRNWAPACAGATAHRLATTQAQRLLIGLASPSSRCSSASPRRNRCSRYSPCTSSPRRRGPNVCLCYRHACETGLPPSRERRPIGWRRPKRSGCSSVLLRHLLAAHRPRQGVIAVVAIAHAHRPREGGDPMCACVTGMHAKLGSRLRGSDGPSAGDDPGAAAAHRPYFAISSLVDGSLLVASPPSSLPLE